MTRKIKTKTSEANNNRLIIIGGMVAVAVILILGFIFNPFSQPTTDIDYSTIPQDRTEDGAFILGNPEAAVTIVAWEDFLCSHCQGYQPELKRFFTDFIATGRARFEFRMLPISETSSIVFGLVECADVLEPNSFWDAHDTMFSIASSGFRDGSGREFAEEMGLSYSALLNCTSEATQYLVDGQLASSLTVGGERVVTGTPSVGWRLNDSEVRFDIINRRPSYEQLAALVNSFSGQ